LAAESTRAGGAFKENPNSEPQGVAGSNSTFATTNTSGATRLDPASDAEARMAQDDWAEEKILSSGFSPSGTSGARKSGEEQSRAAGQHQHKAKPKGFNLQEGGFESDDQKNASFTSEIGSKDDPGRAAETTFETRNAAAGLSSPTQKKISDDTPYRNLASETSA
jgi:hypothetical protein